MPSAVAYSLLDSRVCLSTAAPSSGAAGAPPVASAGAPPAASAGVLVVGFFLRFMEQSFHEWRTLTARRPDGEWRGGGDGRTGAGVPTKWATLPIDWANLPIKWAIEPVEWATLPIDRAVDPIEWAC